MPRRADIADAAIRTLARDGMRGLTHRAVDREAGLAEGSASYYYRTRQALLQATVERLAELDGADIRESAQRANSLGGTPEALADAVAALVVHLLTSGRERQLARYELALEATRRPELRRVLVGSGALIRAMVAGPLAAVGVPEPGQQAADFTAFLDGLLFDQIAGAGARERTPAEWRATIGALLRAIVPGR
jgi:DNA-binding transcriptional regulator YbjK